MWVDMSVWGDGYWQHDGDITECDGCAFGVTDGAAVVRARRVAGLAMPYTIEGTGRPIYTLAGREALERARELLEAAVDEYHRRLICVAKGVEPRTREAIAEAWSRVPL